MKRTVELHSASISLSDVQPGVEPGDPTPVREVICWDVLGVYMKISDFFTHLATITHIHREKKKCLKLYGHATVHRPLSTRKVVFHSR